MDSARQLAKMQIEHTLELRSMQRQSASRMLDRKLDLEIAQGDTYGKSKLQQQREQRDIKDRYADEESRQDLRKDEKQAKLKADEEHLKERQAKEDALQRHQSAERQKLEMDLLNEKAKMQETWLKKEHELRLKMIKQEEEYRAMLRRQTEEMAAVTSDDEKGTLMEKHKKEQERFASDSANELQHYNTSKERAQFDLYQKNKTAELDSRQKNESADLSHDLDMKKARKDSDIENTFQDKTDELERAIRKRDAANKRRDNLQDRLNQYMLEEDNAMYERRSSQRELDNTLRMGLVNSSSGMDRMKAMDDYRRDSHVLAQKSQIESDTRVLMEQAKERGADERELNRIQKDSDEMISLLEDQNEISKTMRDKFMDGSGGLRGLIQKESGSTEDLMSTWERIQQSAFNHITDPAADAVIRMDRNEAMRFAQQMNFYKEWMPKIANRSTGLAPD